MNVKLKDLLFPVEKASISEKLGLGSISSTEFGIFATVNDKDILLNTCSKNYELLPNAELFPVIEKMLTEGGIEFEPTYKMLDYSRFYADYTLKSGAITIGGNRDDKLYPILKIEHSYNGLLKYKLTFGYFRIVCGNGLVVPVEGKEGENIHIIGKHTKQILDSLSQLLDKIKFFTKNQKRFAERFEVLASRFVTKWENRVEDIIEVSGIGKRGFDEIVGRINIESDELGCEVNDWLIYNAFNYHIFNAKTSDGKAYATAPNLRNDQDRKVFDLIFNNPGKIKKKKEKAE